MSITASYRNLTTNAAAISNRISGDLGSFWETLIFAVNLGVERPSIKFDLA